jgi:predicted RNase H-like nuclease (RuvC/YqgF family)
MTLKTAIILIAICCTILMSASRSNQAKYQPDDFASQPSNRTAAAPPGAAQAQNDPNQNDQKQADQNQALRDDLTRMKALVQQMEQNLAFVDTTQSPLKHQFQLEIDMWRTTINQMERRLQSRSHADQVK